MTEEHNNLEIEIENYKQQIEIMRDQITTFSQNEKYFENKLSTLNRIYNEKVRILMTSLQITKKENEHNKQLNKEKNRSDYIQKLQKENEDHEKVIKILRNLVNDEERVDKTIKLKMAKGPARVRVLTKEELKIENKEKTGQIILLQKQIKQIKEDANKVDNNNDEVQQNQQTETNLEPVKVENIEDDQIKLNESFLSQYHNMKMKNEQQQLGLKSQQNMIYKLQQQLNQKNEQIIELSNYKSDYIIIQEQYDQINRIHNDYKDRQKIEMENQQDQEKSNKQNLITIENLKGIIQKQEKKIKYLEIVCLNQKRNLEQLKSQNNDFVSKNEGLETEVNQNKKTNLKLHYQQTGLQARLEAMQKDIKHQQFKLKEEQEQMAEKKIEYQKDIQNLQQQLMNQKSTIVQELCNIGKKYRNEMDTQSDRINNLISENNNYKDQLIKLQMKEMEYHQMIEHLQNQNKLKSAQQIQLKLEQKQQNQEEQRIKNLQQLNDQVKEQRIKLNRQNESLNSNISQVIQNISQQSIYVDNNSSVSQLNIQHITDSNISETSYMNREVEKESNLNEQDYIYINKRLEGELEAEQKKLELMEKLISKQVGQINQIDNKNIQLSQSIYQNQSQSLLHKSRNFNEEISDVSKELSQLSVENKILSIKNEKLSSNISSLIQDQDQYRNFESDISNDQYQ